MATKQLIVDGIGPVSIYKRRGARFIRLSIDGTGNIRVTIPYWLPYRAGSEFVVKKRDWIARHAQPKQLFVDGKSIGKHHSLCFIGTATAKKVRTRVSGGRIFIHLPEDMRAEDPEAQHAAQKASVRALRQEAETLLPGRLSELANLHNFSYRSVQIKQLRSRWGSCNSHGDIVLNLYLMQLPWHLIEYVLLHELMHTQIMAHGRPFWSTLARYVPDLATVRKEMRLYRAQILD